MSHDPLDIAQTLDIAASKPHGGYSFAVDDVLGQYRVIRPLGRGGMGEVYLVEHEILTTRYALKLLPEERSTSSGFIRRFNDEARVMAKLKHPGIVSVNHADVSDGRHYLIMEFIGVDESEESFDLEQAISLAKGGKLSPTIVARLGYQIAMAVGAAHERGVVHRDLKPANVLLTCRDLAVSEAKVTDFGLARILGEDWLHEQIELSLQQTTALNEAMTVVAANGNNSSNTSIIGTYEYMSPEQREGREADARSDIYALGVMLYRMITGRRLMGRARAASQLVPGLNYAWDRLIDSCLEEVPADRPQSMITVADDLRKFIEMEKPIIQFGEECEKKESKKEELLEDEGHRVADEKSKIDDKTSGAKQSSGYFAISVFVIAGIITGFLELEMWQFAISLLPLALLFSLIRRSTLEALFLPLFCGLSYLVVLAFRYNAWAGIGSQIPRLCLMIAPHVVIGIYLAGRGKGNRQDESVR